MKFSVLPRAGTPGTDRLARPRTARRATSGLLAAGVVALSFHLFAAPAAACSPPEQWRDHPACTTTTAPPETTTTQPPTTTTAPEATTTVPETTTTLVDATTSTTVPPSTSAPSTVPSTTPPGPVPSDPPAPGPGEPRLAHTGSSNGRLAGLGLALVLSGVAAVTYAAKRKAVS